MNKQEFLDKLRLALSGKVVPEVVTDTVNYYEEYINGEVRRGREMEDVMNSLGDPRLIARTIVETQGGQSGGSEGKQEEKNRQDGQIQKRYAGFPAWVWLVVLLLVVVAVISVFFKILSVFWPLIAVFAVVIFLVKVFRDWV